MEAIELRIGNWVINPHGIMFIITSGADIDDSEDFEPIELTEEILLKCNLGEFVKIVGNGEYRRLKIFENTYYMPEYLHKFQNLVYETTGKELEVCLA